MQRHLLSLVGLSLFMSVQAQVPGYVPSTGLVSWWPFNGNANDESGTGNDGVLNGPALTEDRFGNSDQAYEFNGTSDYIEIQDDPTLDLETELSISVWINTNDFTQPQYIINKSTNGQSDSWLLDLSANPVNESEIRLIIGGLTPVLPYSDPVVNTNNTWYHVVCTYDLQLVRFYVNGALVNTFPATTNTPTNSNSVFIGAPFDPSNNPQEFDGVIDDIGIWNRALSDAEVTGLYTGSGVGVTESLSASPELRVFPNPSNGSFLLEHSLSGKIDLRIVDITGRQVYMDVLRAFGGHTQHALDLTGLANGTYSIELRTSGGTVTQRVLVD